MLLLNANISSLGAKFFSDVLINNFTQIKLIDLSNNKIMNGGCNYFSDALRTNTTLIDLNLENNGIDSQGAVFLSKSFENMTLKHLDLSNNFIGHKGAFAMADFLTKNKSLTKLSINSNNIGSAGAVRIINSLLQNETLVSLSLKDNKVKTSADDFTNSIIKVLSENHTLEDLHLQENEIDFDTLLSFNNILRKGPRRNVHVSFNLNDDQISKFHKDSFLGVNKNMKMRERLLKRRKTNHGILWVHSFSHDLNNT
jgi:Ran GTPase-activating protein (RanGAP) involved in mRNA processing and transport